jgi:hypothetical protein
MAETFDSFISAAAMHLIRANDCSSQPSSGKTQRSAYSGEISKVHIGKPVGMTEVLHNSAENTAMIEWSVNPAQLFLKTFQSGLFFYAGFKIGLG